MLSISVVENVHTGLEGQNAKTPSSPNKGFCDLQIASRMCEEHSNQTKICGKNTKFTLQYRLTPEG